jgi:hypothetical protein
MLLLLRTPLNDDAILRTRYVSETEKKRLKQRVFGEGKELV